MYTPCVVPQLGPCLPVPLYNATHAMFLLCGSYVAPHWGPTSLFPMFLLCGSMWHNIGPCPPWSPLQCDPCSFCAVPMWHHNWGPASLFPFTMRPCSLRASFVVLRLGPLPTTSLNCAASVPFVHLVSLLQVILYCVAHITFTVLFSAGIFLASMPRPFIST